eukprot:Skav218660  [mRNA]  locus=scaffold365:853473:854864:+ [translate_table: standard]
MHTRPCFNSDSLSHFTSKVSEKPNGSNSASPPARPPKFCGFGKKGMDLLVDACRTTILLRLLVWDPQNFEDLCGATERPVALTTASKKGHFS